MRTTMNIHNVESVKVSKVRQYSGFTVRSIEIEDEEGNKVVIDVFADEAKTLKLRSAR